MLDEITAALNHLITLLHPSINAAGFQEQTSAALQARYANLWFPHDADRGSASRALLWHIHGGGEGQDEDLSKACLRNASDRAHLSESFSSPFTLWIDPGCVAIRLGHGPGVYLAASSSSTVQIIYGREVAAQQQKLQPPLLTLSPSTPALDRSNQTWSSLHSLNFSHARSPSVSSTTSTLMGSRSLSQGSSLSSVDDSEQCPSLAATSAQDSDSELSLEDMIDSGYYKNFDLIDYEDDGEQLGNETVVGDDTLCAEGMPKPAIVNYDGGNVGVLGGGIRLGATAKKPASSRSYSRTYQQYAPALPPPNSMHDFEQSLGFPVPTSAQGEQFIMIDGYAVPKRVRHRGRRSRGRGAGRAARRQAAAMQALTEAEQNLNSLSEQYSVDATATAVSVDSGEDERIMSLVRQRANLVAKDLVRRHLEQERRNTEAKYQHLHQQHQHQQPYQHKQHLQQRYQQQPFPHNSLPLLQQQQQQQISFQPMHFQYPPFAQPLPHCA